MVVVIQAMRNGGADDDDDDYADNERNSTRLDFPCCCLLRALHSSPSLIKPW